MAQTNLIGKNILGYTVSEKLGSGVFGTVYKVIKTNVAGQYVRALKYITIPSEKQYNSILNSMGGDISKADNYFSEMLNNIVSEIRILNDLSEKGVRHIVRYYENDILVTDSPRRYDIFILMEYLTPLKDFIQNTDFLVRDVMKLGLDILVGLQACHSNGIIHRDIKDDNIFVSDKGEYKIGDFGVSKVLKDGTKVDSLKGTPNFLAPEVYLGMESYTKSVDLYSLGIVLYRLLNYSRNPFLPRFPEQFYAQDEDVAFEERMSGKKPEPPSLGGEHIGAVLIKAISNGAERFQTADEFSSALEMAVSNTNADILDEKVKFAVTVHTEFFSDSERREQDATLGETTSFITQEEQIEAERNRSIHKHLFESIGELASDKEKEVVSMVPLPVCEQKEPVVLDKFPFGIFLVLPFITLGLLVISIYISYEIYKSNFIFEFPQISPISTIQFLKNSDLEATDFEVYTTIGERELNALCLYYLKQSQDFKQIENFYYETTEQKLYLSFLSETDQTYHFSVDATVEMEDGNFLFYMKNPKFGSKGYPVPQSYFTAFTENNLVLTIPVKENKFMLRPKSLALDTGVLTFSYQERVLEKLFSVYHENIDDKRVKVHSINGDLPSIFLDFAEMDVNNIEKQLIEECIRLFEEDPENAEQFLYLMKVEKIKDFYEDFAFLLFENVELSELVADSKYDMEQGMLDYQNKFIKFFYEYLFVFPDYTWTSNGIVFEGEVLDYQDVFDYFDSNEKNYPIEFLYKDRTLYAVFDQEEGQVEKILLTRR